jgi:fructose-1,6-bisphosphatase/inositol monophosphatase family enzyme
MREVAASEIMPRWRNLAKADITSKGAAGIVTIADEAAEKALAARLAALLPGSVVVGEEAVAADAGVLEHFRGTAPVWVLDPIDGTSKFAAGSPIFDVMVGLVVAGAPVAGWIYAPAEDVLYLGGAGGGAEMHVGGEARPIRAPSGLGLGQMEGIVSPGAFTNRKRRDPTLVADRFGGYVRHQCSGHNYGRLLAGKSQFQVNFQTYPWDHLPGLAIAAAAGFHAARHDGRPFDPLDAQGGVLIAPDRGTWNDIHGLLLGA